MSSHAFGSPTWSAEKDFALLMLLAGGNRKAAQQLWLRKGRIRAPPGAGAQQSAPKAAQQVARASTTQAGSSPGTGRAEAGDGSPAREARAQPAAAAPEAPGAQDVGMRAHREQAARVAHPIET